MRSTSTAIASIACSIRSSRRHGRRITLPDLPRVNDDHWNPQDDHNGGDHARDGDDEFLF
jgi:hypothetical protein